MIDESSADFATAVALYCDPKRTSLTDVEAKYCSDRIAGRFLTAAASSTSYYFGSHLTHQHRKLAWVMVDDDLVAIRGKSCSEVAAYLKLDDDSAADISKGIRRGRLYLLPKHSAVLCDWDSLVGLMAREYGPLVGQLLCVHLEDFKSLTFDQIQQQDPAYDMLSSLKMTVEMYLQSTNSLAQARAFLMHEIGLNQYAQLPYTSADKGNRALAYMVANGELPTNGNWVDFALA
jgi:hypothetical protein